MGHTGKQARRDRQKGRQMRQKGKTGRDDTWYTQAGRDRQADRQTDETEREERQR